MVGKRKDTLRECMDLPGFLFSPSHRIPCKREVCDVAVLLNVNSLYSIRTVFAYFS